MRVTARSEGKVSKGKAASAQHATASSSTNQGGCPIAGRPHYVLAMLTKQGASAIPPTPVFHSRKGEHILCSKKDPHQPLKVFEKWEPHERAWFEHTQWETLVPYFNLDSSNRARHYNLDDSAILPWRKENLRSLISPESTRSSWSSVHEGGFADVSCIRIDSSSHGFSEVLKGVSRSTLPQR
jgi:hypothetical protein